jgi:hypothetical protein
MSNHDRVEIGVRLRDLTSPIAYRARKITLILDRFYAQIFGEPPIFGVSSSIEFLHRKKLKSAVN